MSRRIFVGDIQGCRVELERLLEAVAFDPAGDVLCPVGDLVNRGPDSLGTLRLLHGVGAEAVLGNHDVHLLRTAAGLRAERPGDTFADVLASGEREELLAWLGALPFVRAWDDLLAVHAGLHPLWSAPEVLLAGRDPLHPDPQTDFATRARSCAPDGERPAQDWPEPPEPFRPWFDYWPPDAAERRTVVFGHWARLDGVHRPRVRGLDTGCVWGGRLTAWIAEEDRLVAVESERAYAEHGS
ncbi:MAG: metallophosphoesterase [Planctomycetota bacterium]|jgi:bis(5'-nucleosyl)-tetraphosphatase (symmetrical)|nr:metallophosphoesterase [Planctomycetota bacterium]MDP6763864.1 metallophosphoesterase [Planctomycetota bacterium]MDP6989657.1 metallophosphoesterase [Planctomycetota bacterium]